VSGPNVDDPSVVVGVMMDVADVMSCEGVADVMSREGVAGVMMRCEGVAGVMMSCEGVAGVVMNVDVDVVEGVAGHGGGAGQAAVGQGQKGSHTSLKKLFNFYCHKG